MKSFCIPLTGLQTVRYFLTLIRIPNLLMTGIAIWFHWYYLLVIPLKTHGVSPSMSIADLILLIFSFATMMAAGYILNDLFDIEIDRINKPLKQIVGNKISMAVARGWMLIFFVLSFGSATFLAIKFMKLPYLLFEPLAGLTLYFYSSVYKRKPLIGNIIIAILCAMVIWLPFFAEKALVKSIGHLIYTHCLLAFLFCSIAAALYTLSREIVKTIQDHDGDQRFNLNTISIAWGKEKAASSAAILLLITDAVIFAFPYFVILRHTASLYTSSLLIIPSFLPVFYLFTHRFEKIAFISTMIKLIMVMGIIALPVLLSQ